jgi:Pyruvate/2-oxoacid:ferredoxin oxidoreductase gamma subunit
MIRIDIHGRRGQGVETSCQILGRAFARHGASARTLTVYDGADHQSPVISSLLIRESHLRDGVGVESQHGHCLFLDPSLLGAMPRVDGVVLVNSQTAPCSRLSGAAHVVAVDADAIVRGLGSGATLAATFAGAFAGATHLLSLNDLAAALMETGRPSGRGKRIEAARRAYRDAAETVGSEGWLRLA